MDMRCLWLGWSFLTWLSAMLCTGGCLLPYWLKGTIKNGVEGVYSDLGLFRRCVYPIYGPNNEVQLQPGCGHYDFGEIPHIYWRVCLVMLGAACCILFFLTFLLFFLGFCLDLLKVQGVYRSCQSGQFIAGLLTIISCILYPLGWSGNTEVSQICGSNITPFTLGRCHIGWAFVLTCAGGLLALLTTTLPLLLDNPCTPAGSLADTSATDTPSRHTGGPTPTRSVIMAPGTATSSRRPTVAGSTCSSPRRPLNTPVHPMLDSQHTALMTSSLLEDGTVVTDDGPPTGMTTSMRSDTTGGNGGPQHQQGSSGPPSQYNLSHSGSHQGPMMISGMSTSQQMLYSGQGHFVPQHHPMASLSMVRPNSSAARYSYISYQSIHGGGPGIQSTAIPTTMKPTQEEPSNQQQVAT